MTSTIDVLHAAADLTLTHGPDPAGCIRAAVYGRPDASLPYWDTTESLLVEEAEYRLQCHVNPGSVDANEDTTVDEWAVGRSVADVRAALFAAAAELEAGVR
ncbi:hypothetical protein AB0M00_43570 [Streptomyces chartreusis]|uniref:hypothetical protein n=1 Tax=Streptomyces chartreusis TaxID=1969 RepID=UPI0034315B16